MTRRSGRGSERASKRAAPRPSLVRPPPADEGHLRRAPIVEALIDFRVAPAPGIALEGIEPLHETIRVDFPVQRTIRFAHGHMDLSDIAKPVATANAGVTGFRYETQDATRIIQARLDGFTFSRLRPYKDWADLRDNARRLWQAYTAVAHPDRVVRIGLRYINRLELPLPVSGLEDWLHTRPDLLNTMPTIADVFMRVMFPLQHQNAFAVITEAIDRSEDVVGVLPLILDIDVFREGAFTPDGDEMWEVLETFRTTKNHLFFNSITPKTRRLFE